MVNQKAKADLGIPGYRFSDERFRSYLQPVQCHHPWHRELLALWPGPLVPSAVSRHLGAFFVLNSIAVPFFPLALRGSVNSWRFRCL